MISDDYAAHMRKEHAGSKWGRTGWKYAGNLFAERIGERPYIQTVLDFGCGKGTMKPFLLERFPHLQIDEYDPGIPDKDKRPHGQYDLVISSDVLEHVEPHLLDDTIAQLDSLTRLVQMHDIACSPTGTIFMEGPYKGRDMHLIVEPPDWWRKRWQQASTLQEHEFIGRFKRSNKGDGWRPRALVVYERTA